MMIKIIIFCLSEAHATYTIIIQNKEIKFDEYKYTIQLVVVCAKWYQFKLRRTQDVKMIILFSIIKLNENGKR